MANAMRGEASLRLSGTEHTLRPTFDALVQAEQEMGSLLALVDRAAENRLTLSEIAALFWFCLPDRTTIDREQVGAAVIELGLVNITPVLRALLTQIVKGAA